MMNEKPSYGIVREDLHQEVICKYGNKHIVWVHSSRLIEWPEGYDCRGTCLDVVCGQCEGKGCEECCNTGKMTREQYAQWATQGGTLGA